jgi:hypothetical protein
MRISTKNIYLLFGFINGDEKAFVDKIKFYWNIEA